MKSKKNNEMRIINNHKYTEYTAYIKTENEEGFIHLECGQGKILLFLVENIEDAYFYDTKEEIRVTLALRNCDYTNLIFYKREVTTITELYQV